MGNISIYEPGLKNLVTSNLDAGFLSFTTDSQAAIDASELLFIAVGTPETKNGQADLRYVLSVATTIGESMKQDKVVINKSTVPVGTADKVNAAIMKALTERQLDAESSVEFDVVSNPEFLKEGSAIADFMKPDRILVGTDKAAVRESMRELYAPFNRNHDRMMFMDVKSAELSKYAANAMLATKISFINEIANIAERVGADVEKVRQGIGSDDRIGFQFIYAGCGYGGSCFPKDIRALSNLALDVNYPADLISSVDEVNNRQKAKIVGMVKRHFQHDLSNMTFAIWGLSFKPNTDDMREATSRVVLDGLWAAGAKIRAYDPVANREAHRLYGVRPDLTLVDSKEQALNGADALIICTEWKNFWAPDFDLIRSKLSTPVIFDGRNIYDPERLKRRGFSYYGIGRGDAVCQDNYL